MAYEKITKYAGRLAKDPGRLTEMEKVGNVWHMPEYIYSPLMESFERDFYDGFADEDYFATLESAGVDMGEVSAETDWESFGAPALLAALTFCVRSERFGGGNLYHAVVRGEVDDILLALKRLDEPAS